MASADNQEAARAAALARARFMLLWVARSMLVVSWLAVVIGAVSSEGLAGLLAWYVLAATSVLVIACLWELAGGLLLIAFCLLFAAFATYRTWSGGEFQAKDMVTAFSVGFGNIYALIAYATMALPGAMLVLAWYFRRKLD